LSDNPLPYDPDRRGLKLRRRFGPGWIVPLLLCAGLALGCGYQLAGRGELPGNVQTIAVRMLKNRSSETGVETLVTNALINELNRRRQGSVIAVERADAVLDGTIQSLSWDTISHRGINTASERRVYATVALTLTDRSGNVLWERSGLQAEQAYIVVDGDKTRTEFNRRQAIAALAEKMAGYVYRRMTDNF
jgi:outer membrane lipopolysaccharide assembly protein LptE/RlpB